MRALLLAAGVGSRLSPLTNILPKCLVPVNGRPLLEYWLRYLTEAGIGPFLVNLHHFSQKVEQFITKGPFAPQVSTVYEKELLGTGGTLLKNCKFFGSEPLMLVHADNLCLCDFKDFARHHTNRPDGTEITMMTFITTTPERSGIVELDGGGVVQAFHEKVKNPPGNLANAAVYLIEPEVIEFLKNLEKPVIDFSTDVLPHYMGRIFTYHNSIYHRDIGNIESLMAAQVEFSGNASFASDYFDPWDSLCGENEPLVAQKILFSISEALGASILPLFPDSSSRIFEGVKILSPMKKSIMFLADRLDGQFKSSIGQAKKDFYSSEKLFIGFHKVPERFSSKEIFEEFGVHSIGIFASPL